MIAFSLGPSYRHRLPRLLLALSAVLAVLWILQINPQAEAFFMPVNLMTAQFSAVILAWMGLPMLRETTLLTHTGGFSCEIDFACTALIPILLLSAGILSWRAERSKQWLAVLIGSLLLFALNQVRIVSLVWLGVHAPGWLDIAHLGFWPLALIVVIVGFWYGWTRAARH